MPLSLSSRLPRAEAVGWIERGDSALGFLRRRRYHGSTRGRSSLRLWLPYGVSPVHHREASVTGWGRGATRLPRFLPLQRLSATRSHLLDPKVSPPPGPIPTVLLRPQGFRSTRRSRALSTPCSPRGLPGPPIRAIPVPLMGFHPSRPCSSLGVARPLGRHAPRGFSASRSG